MYHRRIADLVAIVVVGFLYSSVSAQTVSFRFGVDGYVATEDTKLRQNKAECNFGGSNDIQVQGLGPNPFSAGMIKFPDIFGEGPQDPGDPNYAQVPTFQSGKVIRNATLRLFLANDLITNPSQPKSLIAYPMLVSCNFGDNDGTAANVGEVDYHQRAQAQTNWGPPIHVGPQPGIDWDNTIEGRSDIYFWEPNTINTFIEVDVTEIVEAWHVGLLENHGFLLHGGTDQTASFLSSADHPTEAQRPELVIEYDDPQCGDLLYEPPLGDLTGDCYVTLPDFAELSSQLGNCTLPGDPGCDQLEVPSGEYVITAGAVTVDGVLSEWDDAVWTPLDQVYSGDPSDVTQAQFAAKWDDATNKIYVAARVNDSDHVFQDAWGDWNQSDRLEIYFSVHGGDYQYFQENAQQYVIWRGPTTDSAVLGGERIGGPLAGDPPAVPGDMGFEFQIALDGSEILYEAALTPFEFYDGFVGEPNSVVLDLAQDVTVLFDVVANSKRAGGFGQLAENLSTGKFSDTSAFRQYTLEGAGCGNWGHYPADFNTDCFVDIADVGDFAGNWLDCTNPDLPCDFQAEGLVTTAQFQNGVDGYSSAEDTYLSKQSGRTEYNYGGSDWAIVQDVHTTGRFKEAMIKFEDIFGAGPGQIPPDRTIQSATLSVFVYQDIINNPNVQKGLIAFPMLVNANFGSSDGPALEGEVSRHQRAQAQTDWGPPIHQGPVLDTDWTDSMSASVGYTGANVIELWLDLDITAILTAWYDGTLDNHGLLIQGATDQAAAYFYSSNDLYGGIWSERVPKLTVVYRRDP
jgi:hypothetical protein